jgi:hypothetical protein
VKSVAKEKRKVKKRKKRSSRLPISAARVTAAAFKFETLIEAAGQLNTEPPLEELLGQCPKLAAAWEKGQFYRRLYDVASHMFAEGQAAKKLDISHEKIKEILQADRRAKQLWDEGRFAFGIECKEKMMEGIAQGKPHIISRIENLLNAENKSERPDYGIERVPIQVAAALIGVSRVTLHQYHREKGLGRNSDGTYNLKVLVPWIIKYTEAKMLKGSGETVLDLQRHERGLEIRQRRLEKEGFLKDTREIVKGILLREQAFLDLQKGTLTELAAKMEGKDYEQRMEILTDNYNRQRRERIQLPEQINLPSEGRELLQKLMELLEPKEAE